jgi:hypothetical protein
MNPGDTPLRPESVVELLRLVRQRFYPAADPPAERAFYRDRRMLLCALSWPATWLEQRALTCSAARYRAIIVERLEAIAAHGDPARYGAYFPTYLLKCLQDWFQHHGDDLYAELKHIRNALDHVLASVTSTAEVRRDAQHLAVLASAHQLIAARRSAHPRRRSDQLALPLQ